MDESVKIGMRQIQDTVQRLFGGAPPSRDPHSLIHVPTLTPQPDCQRDSYKQPLAFNPLGLHTKKGGLGRYSDSSPRISASPPPGCQKGQSRHCKMRMVDKGWHFRTWDKHRAPACCQVSAME
jgi:hypothetical protein